MSVRPDQLETLEQLKAGKLNGATRLSLSCNLTQFPPEIFNLADTLEILDLSGNALSSLPDDFNRLSKLKILFCSSNQFTEFPKVLGKSKTLRMIGFKHNQIKRVPPESLPTATLRWLILTDNQLQTLPDSLGDCVNMQKLMLAGNQLTTLPESLQYCQQLELLRISANQLAELPEWLFTLPKLAWLAYAGNPFCNGFTPNVSASKIDWNELTLGKVLGQGASGVTYQALWQPKQGASETIAVKLFKGQVTSDGLPDNEMLANLLVGTHPNLVGVKGVICNHPEGTSGLVMPLLDEDSRILAGPPSFESCTRDIYKPETNYTQNNLCILALSIADAMAYCHASGLMHGDLYAHNVLWNAKKAVLSDLGGSSFLPQSSKLSSLLQRCDVLAFGFLLEEMLTRSAIIDDSLAEPLWQLQSDCTQANIALRPASAEVLKRLKELIG